MVDFYKKVTTGGVIDLPTVTITRPANATQYASGDAVADSTPSDHEFAAMALTNGGTGVIVSATIIDSLNNTPPVAMDILLFNAAPTAVADNAAVVISDAEALTFVGSISITDATHGISPGASNYLYHYNSFVLPFKCAETSTSLWAFLVMRDTYTPTSGEVFTIKLGVLQD